MKQRVTIYRKTSFFMALLIFVVIVFCVSGKYIQSFYMQNNSHRNINSGSVVEKNNPYGFTVYEEFTPKTVAYLKMLGITWIRYQQNWWTIEPERNHFYWKPLDDAVALANNNGIHITLPIQGAPNWALVQKCQGVRILSGIIEMSQFARHLALRYNGKSGYGYVDSYEVGNEEYDENDNLSCRDASFYGPSLKSAYLAIKAASPNALVGMFGLWWTNTSHISTFMQWLYRNGYGHYFDFANYHYYVCSANPSITEGEQPSFDDEWITIHNVLKKYHNENKPIWVTETGWSINDINHSSQCVITPETQEKYIHYVLNEAMGSHFIQHIFLYTINRGNDGMSLTQKDSFTPSFYMLKLFIYKYPEWNR